MQLLILKYIYVNTIFRQVITYMLNNFQTNIAGGQIFGKQQL